MIIWLVIVPASWVELIHRACMQYAYLACLLDHSSNEVKSHAGQFRNFNVLHSTTQALIRSEPVLYLARWDTGAWWRHGIAPIRNYLVWWLPMFTWVWHSWLTRVCWRDGRLAKLYLAVISVFSHFPIYHWFRWNSVPPPHIEPNWYLPLGTTYFLMGRVGNYAPTGARQNYPCAGFSKASVMIWS